MLSRAYQGGVVLLCLAMGACETGGFYECRADKDCPATSMCVDLSCVVRPVYECLADSECAVTSTCVDRNCVVRPTVCDPGAARCDDDLAFVRCDAGGYGEVRYPCPQGTHCAVNEFSGAARCEMLGPPIVKAYCKVEVAAIAGDLDIETEYIPQVVACLSDTDDPELVRMYTVAVRTWVYRALYTGLDRMNDGPLLLKDTGMLQRLPCTCDSVPQNVHYDSARQTAGTYLSRDLDVVAPCFVEGAEPSTSTCEALEADPDPTDTERFVTYNGDLLGSDVQPTPMWNESATSNLGCGSERGAACLSALGFDHQAIFNFYFGADVLLARATSHCVDRSIAVCPTVVESEPVIIDDADPECFTKRCETVSAWTPETVGYGGGSSSTYTNGVVAECAAAWIFNIGRAGRYRVEAYIPFPSGVFLSSKAKYRIRHGGQEEEVEKDLSSAKEWEELGEFDFDAGGDQWLDLTDATGEPYLKYDGRKILIDAVRISPVT